VKIAMLRILYPHDKNIGTAIRERTSQASLTVASCSTSQMWQVVDLFKQSTDQVCPWTNHQIGLHQTTMTPLLSIAH